jgi:hypothetical protein
VTAKPADSNARADTPADDAFTDGIDDAGDFVAGHDRIGHIWKQSFLGDGVAVANAACLYLHPHLAAVGLWKFSFHQLQSTALLRNLDRSHFWHF